MSNTFNETVFLKTKSSLDDVGSSNSVKGSAGEKQVEYQLNKANEGMFVLRDVYLEYQDMTAQIDFIVITSHHCYFVECKNYAGNIEINNSGEFVVNSRPGKKNGRVGIKSPVNQVSDQLEVFTKVCLQDPDRTKQLLNGIRFKDYFKTLVVFANPENIIKAKYAPNDVRSKVIKVDEIVRYIQKDSSSYEGKRLNKSEMQAIGDFFLEKHVEKKVNIQIDELKTDRITDNRKINNEKNKKGNKLLKKAILDFVYIVLVIIFLYFISGAFSSNKNNSSRRGNDNALTKEEIKAINTIKNAYNDSSQNGFSIAHSDACKEIDKLFKEGQVFKGCNTTPIEINVINENQITFYRASTNSCSTLTIDSKKNKLVSAVNETKECHGQPVGFLDYDESNEYYKKIGGYDKLLELARYVYLNDVQPTLYYDYEHVAERGGNPGENWAYESGLQFFFKVLTGKGYQFDVTSVFLNKDEVNKVCKYYYYIMK